MLKISKKKYEIVAIWIPIAKIDLEKIVKRKENIVIQNANMWIGMKIEDIFLLSTLKKDNRTFSLVIKIDDAKMANTLIEK